MNNRDAGMVILPAYYAASLNADESQITQYYVDICEGSPVDTHLTDNSNGGLMCSDSLVTVQFPSQCRRPGYVLGDYQFSHQKSS